MQYSDGESFVVAFPPTKYTEKLSLELIFTGMFECAERIKAECQK